MSTIESLLEEAVSAQYAIHSDGADARVRGLCHGDDTWAATCHKKKRSYRGCGENWRTIRTQSAREIAARNVAASLIVLPWVWSMHSTSIHTTVSSPSLSELRERETHADGLERRTSNTCKICKLHLLFLSKQHRESDIS